VKCSCSRCRNSLCEDKRILTLHFCKFGFMPGYEVWMRHGESVHQITNSQDPPTLEVQKFFDMLRASEEPLHEHTIVSVLTFVTRLTAIKSKFTFSNKCYKELLILINDVLPNNHKMPKDMYQSKKCCLFSVWSTRRSTCKYNCMLFYKEHKNEMLKIW
jgi:hypothetical protein